MRTDSGFSQPDLKANLRRWAKENPISKIYLVGSAARGKMNPGDFDLALEIIEQPGQTASGIFTDEASKWRKELRQILNREVDLLPLNCLELIKTTKIANAALRAGSMLLYCKE